MVLGSEVQVKLGVSVQVSGVRKQMTGDRVWHSASSYSFYHLSSAI